MITKNVKINNPENQEHGSRPITMTAKVPPHYVIVAHLTGVTNFNLHACNIPASVMKNKTAIYQANAYRTDPIQCRISISHRVRLHVGQIKGSSVITKGPFTHWVMQGLFTRPPRVKTRYSHVCGSGTG